MSFTRPLENNASVNSTCAQPPPPRANPRENPRELAFFFSWMANSRGLEHLSCQMPGGGDESRGRMPRPRDRFNPSFHFRALQ